MRPPRNDLAPIQYQDLVSVQYSGNALGDDKAGSSLHEPFEGLLDAILSAIVHAGRGIVKNEDPGIKQERSGNGDALLLSAGKRHPSLSHVGVEPVGKGGDEIMGFTRYGGLDDLGHGGIRTAEGDVLANGPLKQGCFLEHNADLGAQRFQRHVSHVMPVD